jgi:hypothetical protein
VQTLIWQTATSPAERPWLGLATRMSRPTSVFPIHLRNDRRLKVNSSVYIAPTFCLPPTPPCFASNFRALLSLNSPRS